MAITIKNVYKSVIYEIIFMFDLSKTIPKQKRTNALKSEGTTSVKIK